MLDNKKKFSKSKRKVQRSEASYKKLMETEKTKYDAAASKIKNDKSLTQTQKRDKLAKMQLQRRMKEKAARQRLEKLQQTHSANKVKYRSSQKRQLQKYRQRKRAIEFADRNTKTTSTRTSRTRTYGGNGATAVVVTSQPGYAYGGVGGIPPPMQGYGAPMPSQTIPSSSTIEPDSSYLEGTGDGNFENVEESEEAGTTERQSTQRQSFNIIRGVENEEEEVEMIDIPALREMDPKALREFLRARMNFERATTQDEKIRYSVIFFDIAKKLDRMFHLHTDLWHRNMKFRPKQWSVMDANQFTDGLSKDEVERLAALSNEDLRAYLESV